MIEGYIHPDFQNIADVLASRIPKNKAGGAAVAIYHRGECVVDAWGGTKDEELSPWQSDTMSLSYSTTKGVASTLVHILADRGLIDYDTAVAEYWPEFANNGKERITVRQIMTHEAGLYNIRDMIEDATQILDWQHMISVLANSSPIHEPGIAHGYHAITYGWLVGEIIQRVTGKPFAQVLREELVEPLQLDGCYIGLPEEQMARRATLIQKPIGKTKGQQKNSKGKMLLKTMAAVLKIASIDLRQAKLALIPRKVSKLDFNSEQLVRACIPAANGLFTARSLAKIYAVLANGGELNGVRLLSGGTLHKATQIQNETRDRVIPVAMNWRLGYHRIFTFSLRNRADRGFGHFGLGGSGAWADPDRNLAVALVLNSGIGTPLGDARILQITNSAIRCADKRR